MRVICVPVCVHSPLLLCTEKSLGRKTDNISAVVGYAGGRQVGPDGKVCYYLSDPRVSL